MQSLQMQFGKIINLEKKKSCQVFEKNSVMEALTILIFVNQKFSMPHLVHRFSVKYFYSTGKIFFSAR